MKKRRGRRVEWYLDSSDESSRNAQPRSALASPTSARGSTSPYPRPPHIGRAVWTEITDLPNGGPASGAGQPLAEHRAIRKGRPAVFRLHSDASIRVLANQTLQKVSAITFLATVWKEGEGNIG
ncbi:hypothetical protein CSOJ01_13880 [Colletotrichum sojae]|uniref:Uncharacterized protein n=1 Tax=Colletotrichum sojae TaxID=2175907 RepID=A0A8H6IS79_9PEZI|nr:hypothetical protein CSOJ01_13880 [Colletotrichum sojae]